MTAAQYRKIYNKFLELRNSGLDEIGAAEQISQEYGITTEKVRDLVADHDAEIGLDDNDDVGFAGASANTDTLPPRPAKPDWADNSGLGRIGVVPSLP